MSLRPGASPGSSVRASMPSAALRTSPHQMIAATRRRTTRGGIHEAQMSWALLVAEAWEYVSDLLVCFPDSPSSS
jgi:hypothetical protein